MRYKFAAVAVSLALFLPGCVPPPKPAPVAKPAPPPVARPAPPPSVVTPPLAANWNDWPFTPGDWVYRKDGVGSIALFGPPGGDALLTLRCDRTRGAMYLSVQGSGDAATIRTTSLSRSIALRPTGGETGYVASQFVPSDAMLDAMVFSRGRFVVERTGAAPLVVPPYAEIGRVVEDCRG
jgi:hypothetical protein